jgi:hypothetical protein
MVIGYSFGDDHINEAIGKAADAGQLRIFIIDPEGIDVLNKQNARAATRVFEPLVDRLSASIIGASRRPLSSTLVSDQVGLDCVCKDALCQGTPSVKEKSRSLTQYADGTVPAEQVKHPQDRAKIDQFLDDYASNVLEDYHTSIETSFIPSLESALNGDISELRPKVGDGMKG